MKDSDKYRQERARHWEAMKALSEQVKAEGRDLSAEEQATWDAHDAEIERFDDLITRASREEELARQFAEPIGPEGGSGAIREDDGALAQAAFRKFFTGGLQAMSPRELAALQVDQGPTGGYLVPPMQFVRDLIQATDDLVFMRQFGTVTQLTSADSIGRPSLDADPADADWTAEIATGAEDTAMKFGQRELTPHPLAKRIKISNKQLRLAPEVEQLVRDRMAYKFAIPEEKGYLTGNGVNKPLGVFTASADGIPTSRDVVCGSTTAITADGLIDVKYSLKAQYWGRARWLFSRAAMKGIRKLTTTTSGDYVWRPGLAGDAADTVLDSPFSISEYVPATFTTGLYVTLYGDLSFYWIVEALDMQIQRLNELYAETNQTGFIGRKEIDGMPVLAEAFARGKLA